MGAGHRHSKRRGMTKRQIRGRLRTAQKRVAKARGEVDRARQRRDYWSKVSNEMQGRLGMVEDGQMEMEL